MKSTILLGSILLLQLSLFSQSYDVKMGNVIKLKKGVLLIDLLSSDNTGTWFAEKRIVKTGALRMVNEDAGVDLHKVDENFTEVFDKDYVKELKGFAYHSFQTINDNLYLFATDYLKKEDLFKIYGARVDKSTGDLTGDFKELGSFAADSKKEGTALKITSIDNGNALMLVTDLSAEKVLMDVKILGSNLEIRQKTLLDFNYSPGEYDLTEIRFGRNKKFICVGQHYDLKQTKKYKSRGDLKEALLSVFNEQGKKEKEESIVGNGKYMIGVQLVEKKDGNFLLAGLYSNNLKYINLSGFFMAQVNVNTGQIVMNPFTPLNKAMFGKPNELDAGRQANFSKTDQRTLETISDAIGKGEIENNFVLRTITINEADQSVVFTCENSGAVSHGYTRSGNWEVVYDYDNNDIIVFKTGMDGKINWINRIRKFQHEFFTVNDSPGSAGISSLSASFFSKAGAMPLYSSYSSSLINNKLFIIMNDYEEQTVNPAVDEKVFRVINFQKQTNMWAISMDLQTGKMERKILCKNANDQLMTPRHAMVVNNEFYIPSVDYHLFDRTAIRVSKVEVK